MKFLFVDCRHVEIFQRYLYGWGKLTKLRIWLSIFLSSRKIYSCTNSLYSLVNPCHYNWKFRQDETAALGPSFPPSFPSSFVFFFLLSFFPFFACPADLWLLGPLSSAMKPDVLCLPLPQPRGWNSLLFFCASAEIHPAISCQKASLFPFGCNKGLRLKQNI